MHEQQSIAGHLVTRQRLPLAHPSLMTSTSPACLNHLPLVGTSSPRLCRFHGGRATSALMETREHVHKERYRLPACGSWSRPVFLSPPAARSAKLHRHSVRPPLVYCHRGTRSFLEPHPEREGRGACGLPDHSHIA